MENFKIDINDILRFTGIGILIIFIIGYENAEFLQKLKDFGVFSVVVLAFIGGNIFYSIYRTLIYSTVILKLKDVFLKDQKYYTRSYLIGKLGCRSTADANNFFYYLRSKRSMKALTRESSTVHLMYMTSIVFFFYAGYKLFLIDFFSSCSYLVVTVIIGSAAFFNDRVIEKHDYNQIRDIPKEELEALLNLYRSHQE